MHKIILFLTAAHILTAATIATNYTGVTSGGFGLSNTGARAVQFTAAITANVTSVDLWLNAQNPGNTAFLDAYLMADNAGLPGAILEHIGNIPGNPSQNYALANGAASGNTILNAGTKYWIGGATGPGSNVAVAWGSGGNLLPEAGTTSNTVNGAWSILGGNSTAVQFRINSDSAAPTSVPEPATWILTLSVLTFTTLSNKSRNRN